MTAVSIVPGSATSRASQAQDPPRARISSAVAASGWRRRPTIRTRQPSAAKRSAVARPMPLPPPVIRTLFSFPTFVAFERGFGALGTGISRRPAARNASPGRTEGYWRRTCPCRLRCARSSDPGKCWERGRRKSPPARPRGNHC